MKKKGILIIGHGSRYGYNKKIMELQADRLAAMGFGNVYIGFNETSAPSIEESMARMADDGIEEVIAMPFFIASGLHMTRDIPPKLGLSGGVRDAAVKIKGKNMMVHFGTPFGDEPLLAKILHEKILELDGKKGRTGVMVVGHGSKLPYNKDTIMLNAERLSAMGHKDVYHAFNEFNDPRIEPTLEEMIRKGVDEVIVLPLFISPGDHLKNDIPEKIGLKDGMPEGTIERNGRMITVRYAPPVGQDPRLTDVLAEKIRAYR